MQEGAGAGRRLVPAREPRLGQGTPGWQSPAAASLSPGRPPAGSGTVGGTAQAGPGGGGAGRGVAELPVLLCSLFTCLLSPPGPAAGKDRSL